MNEQRFDVIYDQHGYRLDYHFCRQWDDEGGCYGTRADHGYSFEAAKAEIIAHHEREIERWRKMTLDEFNAS